MGAPVTSAVLRCVMALLDDAGMGLTPARAANATSSLTRPGWDQATSTLAAAMVPMPVSSTRPAAGLASTSSAIRFILSVCSEWRASILLARLTASLWAVAVARSSSRWRQRETSVIVLAPRGPRASTSRLMALQSSWANKFVLWLAADSWSRRDMCYYECKPEQGPRALLEPTGAGHDAASLIFNQPDYRVINTVLFPDGIRRATVESTFPPGCTSCSVIASQVKERRCQKLRDISVAGTVVLLWDKQRRICDEYLHERQSFCEATTEFLHRAPSSCRLRETLSEEVIDSGGSVSEAAKAFGIS